jgi:geranylgeranyl pyrophosphate synthase
VIAVDEVIADLGFEDEIAQVKQAISQWVGRADEEVRPALSWQFEGGSKYFRPLTLFSCYRAMHSGPIPASVRQAAVLVEMFHNVSLIVDDIVDKSDERRGKRTLHAQFGELSALMVSGYIVADGFRIAAHDPNHIQLLSELLRRLGVAECLQWRLRRQPLGVEDWRRIAGEDTGSMFEVCACLGTGDDTLRQLGHLVGVLYHGCDDVGDLKGETALGGGGEEDLRDGILTLPAALSIRDPVTRAVFCKDEPSVEDVRGLGETFRAHLAPAEAYLDRLAEEAAGEARLFAANPEPLLALIQHTRQLSRR